MAKKIFYILVLVMAFVSCENREPLTVETPEWLTPRLLELENSGDCHGCTVQRWTYDDQFYYHVYCSYWSCLDCEVYHYDGKLVVWGETVDQADYEANKHRPEKIWECGDEL